MRTVARLLPEPPRLSAVLAGLALALVAGATPVSASPGDLDPSFSRNGSVVTRFRDSYSVATDLALQSDGRIVVVGPVHGNGTIVSDMGVARYTAEGRLDPTFSRNGKRRVDLDDRYDQATAVAVQADGRIVVVGSSGGDVVLVRLMPDGSLDDSFSGDGHRSIDPGGLATVADVAVQADGRIVIAGSTGPDMALARLLPGGALDDDFGTGGIVHADIAGDGAGASAVAIAAEGAIVAAGWATVSAGQRTDFAVARFLAGGTSDPGFGTGGIVTTDFHSWEDAGTDLVVEPSGAIVVAGQASDEPGWADQSSDLGLARYLSDGSPDPSFGDGGIVTTDLGSFFDQAHGVALQADGKIVVSSHRYADGVRTAAVVRYETDGDLDASFGSGGIVDTGRSVSGDEVGGLAIEPGGAIVSATAASVPATIGSTFAFLVLRLQGG